MERKKEDEMTEIDETKYTPLNGCRIRRLEYIPCRIPDDSTSDPVGLSVRFKDTGYRVILLFIH
jgi:hypothetical protein